MDFPAVQQRLPATPHMWCILVIQPRILRAEIRHPGPGASPGALPDSAPRHGPLGTRETRAVRFLPLDGTVQ